MHLSEIPHNLNSVRWNFGALSSRDMAIWIKNERFWGRSLGKRRIKGRIREEIGGERKTDEWKKG